MKQSFMLLLSLMLTGCVTVSIKREFPKLPPSLEKSCSELTLINENTEKLSEVLHVVTANYAKYHECSILVTTWQEWYATQKQIFDEIP